MYFNWSLLLRQTWVSLFRSRGTHLRLTAKRIRALLAFYPLLLMMQVFTRLCWALDSILYPRGTHKGGDRTTERPLFILGNFRSGTTFLYRMLAQDTHNFAAMKTWEIYLAPTLTQRKLYHTILSVDRRLGSPLRRWLIRFNRENLGQVRFHKVGLWEPEEDEGVFLYPWGGLFVWFFFPYRDAVRRFIYYDDTMPRSEGRRYERFYEAVVAKHLRAHPHAGHYLAKSPASCGRIEALLRLYPEARFVYLDREPVAQFRSQMSWLSFAWRYFSDPMEKYPFQRFALRMSSYWTSHAVEVLSRVPDDRVCFLRFEDLVASPKATVERVYARLGYAVTPSFRKVLVEEEEYARSHRQNRTVDVDVLDVSEEEIRAALARVDLNSPRRVGNAGIL